MLERIYPHPDTNVLILRGVKDAYCILSAGTYSFPALNAEVQKGTRVRVIATGAVILNNAAAELRATLASGEWSDATYVSLSDFKATVVSGAGDDFDARTLASALPAGYATYTDALTIDGLLTGLLSQQLTSGNVHAVNVGIPLSTFREVTSGGDPGNIAANGGVLASDTDPIYLGDANEALCIQWAASNSDIIAAEVPLPANFDGTQAVLVDLLVQSAGLTNTPTFSVLTNWDGGTQVTDSATGTSSTSKQTITATIAAADIADAATSLSIQLVPGTHAADAWNLYSVRVRAGATIIAV